MHHEQGAGLVEYFTRKCALNLHEAGDKEPVKPGCVYFAPPNYHLLVEPDRTFSLSVDEKVHYSRPSIDVLFESAAHAWGRDLVGIVLTGANADGAYGLQVIKGLIFFSSNSAIFASSSRPVSVSALVWLGEAQRAVALCERAVASAPDNLIDQTRARYGHALLHVDRGEEGLAQIERAIAASPSDHFTPPWHYVFRQVHCTICCL